ncbi:MAG: tetratricopeptide repeat protein [Leptolyngbya sp.]|nr:tetratricopeptide repeat protein [Candidatus Melainabacteria bacterium]
MAEVSKLDAMKSREFLQKGNGHLNRLEFQKALEAYTESLLCDPDNRVVKDNIVLTHNNWGIWYFQKQKYKEAREEWDQALKLNPRDANARQNLRVLQATLSRQGLQSDDGSQKSAVKPPKPDFPPSQVIILTPGLKQSGSNSATPESPSGAATPASSAPSASADPFSSESSSGGTGGARIISSPASNSPASSTPSAPTASAPPKNIPVSVPIVTTAAPVSTPSSLTNSDKSSSSSQSSATAGGSQGDNFEEQIGQIELKINGRKQESMPIMKRLEKLEIDTHGQKKSGTIKERIDTLRKSYGI